MAKDRRAMGNPFAGIKKDPPPAAAPAPEASAVVATEPAPVSEAVPVVASPAPPRVKGVAKTTAREFVGFRLTPALLDRARAVAWTERLSLTAYVEAAIEAAVIAAERTHGGPFPPVPRRSRVG